MSACAGQVDVKPKDLLPLADAGADRVAAIGTQVVLDGTGSRLLEGAADGALEYDWTVIALPSGSAMSLAGPDTVQPTFVVDVVGEYIFRLVVSTAEAPSAPDVVVVRGVDPLRVVQQVPQVASSWARTDTPILVRFSEAVQADTVTLDTIQVLEGNQRVEGLVSLDSGRDVALFVPAADYAEGARLTLVVTQGVVSTRGNALPAAYRGSFTVGTADDIIRPRVMSVTPASADTDVGLGQPVVVTFSEPMDVTTLDAASFAVSDGSTDVAGELEAVAEGLGAIFSPTAPWSASTTHTLTVLSTATDTNGNQLDGDGSGGSFVSTFSTEAADNVPPKVLASYPSLGIVDFPLGGALTLTFSEALDPATVSIDSVSLAGSGPIAGTVSLRDGGRTVVIVPTQLLSPGIFYTLTVAGTIADLSGLTLDADGDGTSGGTYVVNFAATDEPTFDGSIVLPADIRPGDAVTISLNDRDEDRTVAADTVVVDLATSRGEAERLSMRETAGSSGVFRTTIDSVFSDVPGASGDRTINIIGGDTVTVSYTDARSAAGIPRRLSQDLVILESLAQVVVGSVSGNTTEAGGTVTFDVVLASAPIGDVTISFDSDTLTEGTVTPTSFTFTSADWDMPQTATITGVNDALADRDQAYAIVFQPSVSIDGAYDGVTPANVTLMNIDDDSPNILIGSITGDTLEGGTSETFSVVLTTEPTADVIVSLDSDNYGEGLVDKTTLVFTSSDWNVAQVVTVTGVPDDIDDGDVAYAIDFGAAVSSDMDYDGLQPSSVGLINIDDDATGFAVGAVSGATNEGGDTATFSLALTAEPTADVTVAFDSDTLSEATVAPTSFVFTASDWSIPQVVVMTGIDDDIDDGDQGLLVTFEATDSVDSLYAAITPADVAVTNEDDDVAGFDVSPISGPTSEGGGTATFTIALTSEPTADVTVNFDSNDSGEGTVAINNLIFTDTDWADVQTVTVTGFNDGLVDGNQDYAIDFFATSTLDDVYVLLTPASVSITNVDDDTPGITATAVSRDTTELGRTATFAIVLSAQPTANVVVPFASDDATEGITSVSEVTFTTITWNEPQVVTVTGQDDDLQDGDVAYNIVFAEAVSTDATYDTLKPSSDLTVMNREAGTNALVKIGQATFTLGNGVTLFVAGDFDEYANLSGGTGNDSLIVQLSSDATGDVESTVLLVESMTVEGDFDCTVNGCLMATEDNGTAVADDGILQAVAGETIRITYVDAMRADGATDVLVQSTATAVGASCVSVVLNEVVSSPQQDWDDSANGDATPFSAVAGDGTVDGGDTWVELSNTGCGFDLSGYRLRMFDSTSYDYTFGSTADGQALVFSAGGAVADVRIGEHLVVGYPSAAQGLDDDVWIVLEEPSGGILDAVALGSSVAGDGNSSNNAPSGASSDLATEAIRRDSVSTDTDADDADWSQGAASIGSTN